jgi:predicted ribosomally synthesized peptide with SipW-like signal peptide
MTERYKLSRRKALAGLGTIGVAGAGAGLGTSALFSDTESFEDNVVQAGTLNMGVTADVVAANDYWEPDLTNVQGTADGDAVTGLQVHDVKPGDWGIICFQVCIWDNPGYVQVSTENFAQYENGQTEPEAEDDTTGGDPGKGNGELQDEMIAEVYATYDDSGTIGGLGGLDSTTSTGSAGPSNDRSSVAETNTTYSTGVTLRDGSGNPLEVGGDSETYGWDPESDGLPIDDSQFSDAAGALCEEWYLLLELPEEVGNEVQSDSFEFDLVFDAEQVRNNDDPFSS